MFKRNRLLLGIIFLASLLFLAYFMVRAYSLITAPLSKEPIHYLFEPGASVRRLAVDLQQRHLFEHPRLFLLLAYLKGAADQLKAGEYYFDSGVSASQLLDQMRAGQMIVHRFTIVEGWTVQQLLKAFYTSPYIQASTQKNLSQLFVKSGLPRQNPEGLFFPATYYFSGQTTDSDLLKRAYQLLDKKLNTAWSQRVDHLPYKTPYEGLIAASLVEKETALPKERPMIAGVIARRLAKGIPLQIDATVIYGLGAAYFGKLTSDDLKKDNPYNTYTRRGLPPTPIAMPSLNAIEAVFHPDQSQNLYFVAKGDGSHQFSSDLMQHNEAVKRYQLDRHYPNILPKRYHCESQWYLSKKMKHFFCLLEAFSVAQNSDLVQLNSLSKSKVAPSTAVVLKKKPLPTHKKLYSSPNHTVSNRNPPKKKNNDSHHPSIVQPVRGRISESYERKMPTEARFVDYIRRD
jgi:UPF0755 protein